MRCLHDQFLDAIEEERRRLLTRRRLLAGGATAAGLGLLSYGFGGPRFGAAQQATPAAVAQNATPQVTVERNFANDVDVLNYALTLEHLAFAFYRDGMSRFDFGVDPFGNAINDYLALIHSQEGTHVATLTDAVTRLGGTPVVEQTYNFATAYAAPHAFLQTAQALENTAVSAYDGAGAALKDPALLTAAGTIVAVEGEHAAYFNVVNNLMPAPQPFETPLSRAEVMRIAAPFLGAAGATPAAATPTA
jgi:hypothetical protein